MKGISLLILLTFLPEIISAQLSITKDESVYTIDFDNTVSGVNNGQYSASGFSNSPSSGQINSNAFQVTGLSDSTLAFGGTLTSGDYARGTSDGGVSTGGLYAFQVSASNYAFGIQPTNSDLTPGEIILKVQNNTGDLITHATVMYKVYTYNNENKANSFNFSHSNDNSSYTAEADLDYTSTAAADVSPAWSSVSRADTVLVAVEDGNYLYLKWSTNYSSGSNSMDEFAVDDITIQLHKNKVFINEVRSNDDGTDDAEFIELVGPSGFDIDGYKITHYNGAASSDGGIGSITISTFEFPDDGVTGNNGDKLGYFVAAATGVANLDKSFSFGLQNGPDGIVLCNANGDVLDAVAWGGAGDLTDDDPGTVSTAVSSTSRTYLHVLSSDDATDNSLSAPNTVFSDDGSGWIVTTATPGAINSNQSSGSVEVPVELVSFSAELVNYGVRLEWNTATEVDNYGFDVERKNSADRNGNWEKIIFVKGHGNSNSPQNYSFTDKIGTKSEIGKTVQYRLKQIDFDGTFEYSQAVQVEIKFPAVLKLNQNYPNPFNPETKINFNLPAAGKVRLAVYNLLGEEISKLLDEELNPGMHTVSFNSGGLASGIYYYSIQFGSEILVRKMIVLK